MHLVTVVALKGPLEPALGPIAECLGITPYELRIVFNAGLPAVVLAVDDAERAADTTALIRRLGHAAVVADRNEIVSSRAMIRLRDFALTAEGIAPTADSPERLPYADLLCLLRSVHRSTTETVETVKDRKLRPGMAIATGGLVMSKEVEREVVSRQESRQQVLYLFRRSGLTPWILRERETHYGALGKAMQPTSLLNFNTTLELIRARSPGAPYDDRLMRPRPVRGISNEIEACDILAHALAEHYAGRI
jgi:hypothetical protein